jgi:methyltransferase
VLGTICFVIFRCQRGSLWVIRTMGEHWNVQVMNSTSLGVVTTGPFCYVRHPNYAAVFTEMLVLP